VEDIRKQSNEQASNNEQGDNTDKEEPDTKDIRNIRADTVATKSVEQSEMYQEVQLSNNLEEDTNDDSDSVFGEMVNHERIEEDISSHVDKVSCNDFDDIGNGIIAKLSSLCAELNSKSDTKASIIDKTEDSGKSGI